MMSIAMFRALKRLVAPDALWRAPILSGPFRGVVISFNPSIETRKILGLYEQPLQQVMRKLVLGTRIDCFDLGAGNGYYTSVFRALSLGRILAIDMGQAEVSIILQSYGGDPRVTAECIRIGATEETGGTTIDRLVERHFLPHLIKIDIEGHEAAALQGAQATLAAGRTIWIIETHGEDIESRCITILKAAGCRIQIIASDASERAYRGLAHNRWLVAIPDEG
jgi:hypothetical protein